MCVRVRVCVCVCVCFRARSRCACVRALSLQVVSEWGLSQSFIGVVILPIVGNAAEHVTAVTASYKGKTNLAIGVAVPHTRKCMRVRARANVPACLPACLRVHLCVRACVCACIRACVRRRDIGGGQALL